MNFSVDFKQKVYNIFQFNQHLNKIMESLEANDDLAFRFLLDTEIDRMQEALRPRVLPDWGEALVWNAQVNYWLELNSIYTDLMEMYEQEDKENLENIIKRGAQEYDNK